MTDVVSVYAPNHVDPYDSYGLIALELARHLTRLGVYVNVFSLGERSADTQDAETAAIVNRPIRPAFGSIMLGYPTSYEEHQNPLSQMGPRVAITMFESSRIPDDWVEPLNRCDAVIVPSAFCRDVFTSCGITTPVHVIPLGISEAYTLRDEPVHRHGPRAGGDRPLTFLAFLDRGLRKGGVHALQAFLRAFGDSPGYRLILKSRDPRVGLELQNANIDVIQRDMTAEELNRLYRQCDVLINPNMGEGFGLIPREFAATGGISLATDWGGTADGMEAWGWPLPYALGTADWKGNKTLQGQELGVWALPDADGIAHALRHVADNLEMYAERARRNAPVVRRMYDWRRFAEGVLGIWQEVSVGNRIAA